MNQRISQKLVKTHTNSFWNFCVFWFCLEMWGQTNFELIQNFKFKCFFGLESYFYQCRWNLDNALIFVHIDCLTSYLFNKKSQLRSLLARCRRQIFVSLSSLLSIRCLLQSGLLNDYSTIIMIVVIVIVSWKVSRRLHDIFVCLLLFSLQNVTD